MKNINLCLELDSIPAKSINKFKLLDLEFFIREKQGIMFVYECSSKKLILVGVKSTEYIIGLNKDKIMNFLNEHYKEIYEATKNYYKDKTNSTIKT